jgi:hypothetical protein
MNPNPADMVLVVSFDIEQTSEVLTADFGRSDGKGHPNKGKAAGSINFSAGTNFFVQIRGGSEESFPGFEVLNCCLITVPNVYRRDPETNKYALPSLFASDQQSEVENACIVLPADQFQARDVQPSKDYFEIIQDWTDHLTVGPYNGSWKLSMVLTVRIARADGTHSDRVFAFDPESTVDDGASPP